MFPNFRLMAASTLVSIMALFFAFGLYASLRVSHEPLGQPSRNAPLQLVGLNVAMLPITVLQPFASQHLGPVAGDGSSVLAYSGAQASQTSLPVTGASDAHEDNAAAAAPVENSDVTKTNSDVTQTPDVAGLEAVHETKSPDEAMQESSQPAEILPPSVTEHAPLPAPPPAASAPPQHSPVEQTAVIETMPADVFGDPRVAAEISAKEKKKRAAKRHLYHAQPHAVAQTTASQLTAYPFGIGGPFVSPPKR